jgi:hypothetical protein
MSTEQHIPFFLNIQGQGLFDVPVPFPPGVVNRNSLVLANICEVQMPPGEFTPNQPVGIPFQGDATMTIHNIVPKEDGSVSVRVEISGSDTLNARLQFFIG